MLSVLSPSTEKWMKIPCIAFIYPKKLYGRVFAVHLDQDYETHKGYGYNFTDIKTGFAAFTLGNTRADAIYHGIKAIRQAGKKRLMTQINKSIKKYNSNTDNPITG